MTRTHAPKLILQSGIRQHSSAFRHAIRDLLAHPIAHFLAIISIATALALPTGVFSLLSSIEGVTQSWDQGKEINLYMEPGTSSKDLAKVSKQLQARSDVEKVRLISSGSAIKNLESVTGLKGIQALLGKETLPPVLIVSPSSSILDSSPNTEASAKLDTLGVEFSKLPNVREVEFDKDWVTQMNTTLSALRSFGWLISALFGLIVVLVISSTMRMSVVERRSEIEVTKLVGGSNPFIQRPFLYTALFLALASSILALVLVSLGLSVLTEPLSNLIGIFSGSISSGIGLGTSITVIIFACAISLISAWTTVHFQLQMIEPH